MKIIPEPIHTPGIRLTGFSGTPHDVQNGEVWYDTSTAKAKLRQNTVNHNLVGPFREDGAIIMGASDSTKQLRIDVDTNISSGNTRVISAADRYVDLEHELMMGMDPHQRIFTHPYALRNGTCIFDSDFAYFIYMGRVAVVTMTIQYVCFRVTSAGGGAQTAEVGLFSTPSAPNGASQTVTKLTATGSLDSLTTNGYKANSSAFSYNIAGGTHLWAGIRTAMATTQPTTNAIQRHEDTSGSVLVTATAGALTGSGPWTGDLPAGEQIPDLIVTLD